MVDFREDERARNANEMLNEMTDREKIERAMEEMQDSFPGVVGVRLRYVCEVHEEVRIIFQKRAHE